MPGAVTTWVRGLSGLEFGLVAGGLVLATAAAFYLTWRYLRRARIIEDTPPSRVRSAAQGYVELRGRGAPMDGPPIIAALTGTPCLWYRFKVEQRECGMDARGGSRSLWRTVRSGISDGLFLFTDETGCCVVDPDGAEVTPGVRDVWYGDTAEPTTHPGTARVQRGRLLGLVSGYRYTEERLMPGTLYALGEFRTVAGSDVRVSDEVRALLASWKDDQAALLRRFDRNGDGRIEPDEWEDARRAALEQVRAERREESGATPPSVLSRPAESRQPFLLAACPEATLIRRYRTRAGLALGGFALGASLLLWACGARQL